MADHTVKLYFTLIDNTSEEGRQQTFATSVEEGSTLRQLSRALMDKDFKAIPCNYPSKPWVELLKKTPDDHLVAYLPGMTIICPDYRFTGISEQIYLHIGCRDSINAPSPADQP